MYCGDKAAGYMGNKRKWSPSTAPGPQRLRLPIVSLRKESGAGDETRTRDVLLGKEVLYH